MLSHMDVFKHTSKQQADFRKQAIRAYTNIAATDKCDTSVSGTVGVQNPKCSPAQNPDVIRVCNSAQTHNCPKV